MVIIIIILFGVSAAQNLTFPLSRLCRARSLFRSPLGMAHSPTPSALRAAAAVGGTRERVSEQE